MSSVWFRCQLNKTFLVSLPDRRQLISTVPRTAVQPLCTTEKSPQKATHIENGRHHPRTFFKQRIPHQTQDPGKSVLKPAPLDLSGFHKYLNFDKDELKSFWKYAKKENQSSKSQLKHLVYIDPPIPPFRTLSGDVTSGWGGRASLCSGEGWDEATRGPSCPQRNHSHATASSLNAAASRLQKKQDWNQQDVRLRHVTAIYASTRPKQHLLDHNCRPWEGFPEIIYVMFSNVKSGQLN